MVVGLLAVGLSIFVPEVITPFSHGAPMGEAGGLFGGAKQYKFMRAFFGLSVCTIVGVTVSFFTKPEQAAVRVGLGEGLRPIPKN